MARNDREGEGVRMMGPGYRVPRLSTSRAVRKSPRAFPRRRRASAADAPACPITIAVLTSPPARERSERAFRGELLVAAATIRNARSFSFAEPARRSTIHGPKTLPEEA